MEDKKQGSKTKRIVIGALTAGALAALTYLVSQGVIAPGIADTIIDAVKSISAGT